MVRGKPDVPVLKQCAMCGTEVWRSPGSRYLPSCSNLCRRRIRDGWSEELPARSTGLACLARHANGKRQRRSPLDSQRAIALTAARGSQPRPTDRQSRTAPNGARRGLGADADAHVSTTRQASSGSANSCASILHKARPARTAYSQSRDYQIPSTSCRFHVVDATTSRTW